MSPFPALDLSLANDFDAMARAVQRADAFLQGLGLPPRPLYVARLAMDEILSNIIQYAHPEQGGRDIGLRLAMEEGGLRLTFSDSGQPFDPLSAPRPRLDLSLEDRPVGGLGIHMIRDMAREMRYRRENGRNILDIWVGRDETLTGPRLSPSSH